MTKMPQPPNPWEQVLDSLQRIEDRLTNYESRVTAIETRCASVQETKRMLHGMLISIVTIAISMVGLVFELWK